MYGGVTQRLSSAELARVFEAEDLARLPGERYNLRALLRSAPADGLVAYPVSGGVNSPRNDGPELIEPVPIEG